MSMICLYGLVLLFVATYSQNYDDENFLNDRLFYPPTIIHSKPKFIKANIGSNETLECFDDLNDCSLHRGHIKWQFKACSSDVKGISCEQFYENIYESGNRDRWIKVHPKHSRTYRYSCDLDIVNVSRSHNGLYRCIVNNKIKRAYEIIVSERINTNGKIVIDPKNITIPTNTELVIRCSVNNPSSIMWFKETDANGYDIMYDGHYYSKLSTTIYPNHILESTEYQSKLSIRKVSLSDSGVYVCVGVNEDSIKTEVNVVSVIGYNWEPHTSFSLLFLIPLAFALVPITVWLCYFRKKRKDYDRQRMKLVVNTRNIPSSRV